MILYLLSANARKADQAEHIVASGGIISVQVLNEVTSVCRKKLTMDWAEIEAVLQAIKASLDILPLTEASHTKAVAIAQRYQLSFYDAHICASALIAGASELLSEDMQAGLGMDGLTVRNPFV